MTKEVLIHEVNKLSSIPAALDSRLQEDLMLSSLKMMMLIVRIEELTEKDFPMTKMGDVHTVQDLYTLINDSQD